MATVVPRSKKAVAAAHIEVKATPIADLFFDADWMLDEVIEDGVTAAVVAGIEPRAAAMLARLDKLPGKLGFS